MTVMSWLRFTISLWLLRMAVKVAGWLLLVAVAVAVWPVTLVMAAGYWRPGGMGGRRPGCAAPPPGPCWSPPSTPSRT